MFYDLTIFGPIYKVLFSKYKILIQKICISSIKFRFTKFYNRTTKTY